MTLTWSDWRFLYLDPKGRITRQAFWFGAVPLYFALAVLASVLAFILRGLVGHPSPLAGLGTIVAILAFAWPFWCLAAKRRHDRGGSGVEAVVYASLLLLQLIWRVTLIDFSAQPPRRFGAPRPGIAELLAAIPTSPTSYMVVSGAISLLGLIVLLLLGFAQGKPGANRYGPDPRANLPAPT